MKDMRLLLCLLVCSFQLRADVINGDTDPVGVPRDLSINKIFAGYDSSQTTSIKKHILTHLSGDNLRMLASTSLLHLHNVSLELDGTYTFTHGSIEVVGKVEIIGSGHKFRLASHSIYIADSSELVIGDGVEFEFAPTSSLQTAVHFGSESSKLTLNSSTLTVGNNLGMHLIGGNLNIEGNSIIDNVFTDTHKALVLGTNMSGTLGTGDGDCKLKINYGAKLTVKKAGIIFKNNGVGSLDASNGEGTLVIDSTGNFLFNSVANLNDSGVSFDFSKLEALYQLGGVTGLNSTPVAEIIYNAWVKSVNFSPDGKYLAIGANINGLDQEIAVYRFDGSSLTKVAEIIYNAVVLSVNFSPDGKYLAIGGSGAGEEIAVYRFDGSSLTKVADIAYNAWVRSVNFSPDGKYLAIGGSGAGEEIAVYRFDGSSLTKVAEIPYNASAESVNFSPDGKYLAVGGGMGGTDEGIAVYRFDGSSLTKVAEIDYNKWVYSVDFSPDGKYLAIGGNTGGLDQEIAVYRFDGSSLTKVTEIPYDVFVNSVNFSPDGKYLAIGGGQTSGPDQELAVYRFDGSSLTKVAEIPYNVPVYSVNFSPDGKYLAIGANINGADEPIAVYEMNYNLGEKIANISNSTIKLSRDLKLENINLNIH